MKIVISVLALLLVFIISFLAWPDFGAKFDYNCDGVPAKALSSGGECPVKKTLDFGDTQLGGGWRYIDNNVCATDDTIYLNSLDACAAPDSEMRNEPRELPYAWLGSLVITTVVGLFYFTVGRRYVGKGA